MSGKREELYRRLEQVRRHVVAAGDDVTKKRMLTLIADLEREIAAIEAVETDAPPD
jgi:hypothetical protein